MTSSNRPKRGLNAKQVHKPRGLAALKLRDPARFKEITDLGRKASPTKFTKDNAREMGRRGLQKRWGKRAEDV